MYINVPNGKRLTANKGRYRWEGPQSVPKAGGWRFDKTFVDGTEWEFSEKEEFGENIFEEIIEESTIEETPEVKTPEVAEKEEKSKPKKTKKPKASKKKSEEVKDEPKDVEVSTDKGVCTPSQPSETPTREDKGSEAS